MRSFERGERFFEAANGALNVFVRSAGIGGEGVGWESPRLTTQLREEVLQLSTLSRAERIRGAQALFDFGNRLFDHW